MNEDISKIQALLNPEAYSPPIPSAPPLEQVICQEAKLGDDEDPGAPAQVVQGKKHRHHRKQTRHLAASTTEVVSLPPAAPVQATPQASTQIIPRSNASARGENRSYRLISACCCCLILSGIGVGLYFLVKHFFSMPGSEKNPTFPGIVPNGTEFNSSQILPVFPSNFSDSSVNSGLSLFKSLLRGGLENNLGPMPALKN
ncbi:MAG: hypothetical protein K0R66_788 [Gammaproteobacteria bacterium]|jgi:hypothetical protein|nr:hypothetical protein [Gammaproteobacteria bacterium]